MQTPPPSTTKIGYTRTAVNPKLPSGPKKKNRNDFRYCGKTGPGALPGRYHASWPKPFPSVSFRAARATSGLAS